jgi:hypothetical protein
MKCPRCGEEMVICLYREGEEHCYYICPSCLKEEMAVKPEGLIDEINIDYNVFVQGKINGSQSKR